MSAQSGEADDSPSCKQPIAMPAQSLDEAGRQQTRSWDLHRGSQASVVLYFMPRQTSSCSNKEKEEVHLNAQTQKCQVDTVQVDAEETV